MVREGDTEVCRQCNVLLGDLLVADLYKGKYGLMMNFWIVKTSAWRILRRGEFMESLYL